MDEQNMTLRMNQQGAAAGIRALEELAAVAEAPRSAQEEFLLKIIRDNEQTEYGKKYHFSEIRSIEDYQRLVPVITYDDIDEAIERMKNGESNVLTAYHFNHMNETSGTVGKQKAVPLTDEQTAVFMKYSNQISLGILASSPLISADWMNGRSFSPAEGNYRRLASGITVGCASSMMAEACMGDMEPYSAMLKAMYSSPPEAMKPGPGINTRYMHTRFALMDRDLTGITGGFPSNLVHLMTYIRDNYQMLIDDIEHGTVDESVEMPEEIRASLLKRISPMPERAAELREIFKNGPDVQFMPLVWPKMQYIYMAGGDGFQVYDDVLYDLYHGGKIHKLYSGVTASEGLWSAPFEVDNPNSVLVPDSAFMEFLPVEAGDDFSQLTTMDKLEVGRVYELFITNLCGFYRYRMSDAVKVTGFWHHTPTVQFMYRVNKTINMACEKTTELALDVTMRNTAKRLGVEMLDFEVYPDTGSVPGKYVMLLETYSEKRSSISKEQLDQILYEELCKANPEFKECCDESLILKPDGYFEQPETQLLYRDLMIMKGASSQQLKPVHVITNDQQRKFFLHMVE